LFPDLSSTANEQFHRLSAEGTHPGRKSSAQGLNAALVLIYGRVLSAPTNLGYRNSNLPLRARSLAVPTDMLDCRETTIGIGMTHDLAPLA
jgi:hypothetical protein